MDWKKMVASLQFVCGCVLLGENLETCLAPMEPVKPVKIKNRGTTEPWFLLSTLYD